MPELIDNIDLDLQRRITVFVKLFRFFNQCSFYAKPDDGVRRGAWLLILQFLLLPFVLLLIIIIDYSAIAFVIALVVTIITSLILLLFDILYIFVSNKKLMSIRKHWFVLKTPFFMSKMKRFQYALYFYLLFYGMLFAPLTIFLLLDYFQYYKDSILHPW